MCSEKFFVMKSHQIISQHTHIGAVLMFPLIVTKAACWTTIFCRLISRGEHRDLHTKSGARLSTYRTVLHDDALVIDEQTLQRFNNSSQHAFIFVILIQIHGIENIMHCYHAITFRLNARAYTTQLQHLTANTQDKSQMNAHGTNVGASLTTNPKDTFCEWIVEEEMECLG